MNEKKRNCFFAVLVFLLATVFLTACNKNKDSLPEGIPAVPSSRVIDISDVFSPNEEKKLLQVIDHYENIAGGQICVLTIDTTNGIPIEDYTMQILKKWRIGESGKNDGVMLTLAVKDCSSRIDVGLGLEDILTDARCSVLLQEMVPYLHAGRYAEACANAIKGMETIRLEN